MSETENARTTANGASTRPLGVVDVDWNLVVPEVDIHLVGYGDRLPNDFTLEMLAVLQRCTRVFGAPPIHAPDFKVPAMENLLELYSPARHRDESHEEMAEVVLAAAAADPPVALATYGSPMVGTYVAHRVVELAPQRDLTVHVTNAVPSFDGIWADFNIDPFFGFEIWDATTFVRLGVVPSTRAHLLLSQAPMLDVTAGIDLDPPQLGKSPSASVLRDHLLRFYAPEHEVHFVTTEAGTGPHLLAAGIETIALRDLDDLGRRQLGTLLVQRGERLPFDFERSAPAGAAAD